MPLEQVTCDTCGCQYEDSDGAILLECDECQSKDKETNFQAALREYTLQALNTPFTQTVITTTDIPGHFGANPYTYVIYPTYANTTMRQAVAYDLQQNPTQNND